MIDAELTAPVPLTTDHDLTPFDCGMASLNEWLKRRALRNEASGASRSYVTHVDSRVVGYYCLAAGSIIRDEAPKPMQRNMPDPIPVMVLGRLAVDQHHQGQGIGTALLRDAVMRVLQVASMVGVKAVLAHAISEDARQFYLVNGLLESPIKPLTLCLPLDTARRVLAT